MCGFGCGCCTGWWRLQQEVQRTTAYGFALVSTAHLPPGGPEGDIMVPVVALGKMMMSKQKHGPGGLIRVGVSPVMTAAEAFCLRLFALDMVEKSAAGVF
jgi:hypothetical protein